MKLNICEFPSRRSHGKNKSFSWEEFTAKLSHPTITHEKSSEFSKFTKDRQSEIKDVGGFIGGYVKEGKRNNKNIDSRSMVVLDADFAGEDFSDAVKEVFEGHAYVIYPTHKSRKGDRKYRLIFPLNRDIEPEEYEPVSRWIANRVGMSRFDPTTYQPSRLMFYPSISSDAEYDFENTQGLFLDPDLILSTYHDWKDVSEWYISESETQQISKRVESTQKKQDPTEKKGVIGAFCKAFGIHDSIEKFLSDVYESTDHKDRYTYIPGQTSSGLVVYEDKFAYSHHSTDPCGGELLNSFDLVRIHKFGYLDEKVKDKYGEALPSFQKMREFCSEIPEVKRELVKSKVDAFDDFKDELGEIKNDEKKWIDLLDVVPKTGALKNTAKNFKLILENDLAFKDKLAKNLMLTRPVKLSKMPWDNENLIYPCVWKDEDDASLRNFIEEKYDLHAKEKLNDALTEVFAVHAFHPVRDYLDSLTWDQVERLDSVLIDYLGAEDTSYTRAVTRKAFTAAVARIFEPGIKFDYMLLMIGSQGRGKSHFLKTMGGEYFNDTLTTAGGKESYEALDGSWIVEMAEMTAAKRSDIEALKQFISKQSDKYRKAYDRRVTDNPRQCVFFGTTNEYECLRDYTGNRRFWIVDVHDGKGSKNQFEELDDERDQLWAEAVYRYKNKETLFLTRDLEDQARKVQDDHTFRSTRWADIREYLNTKLPVNWYEMEKFDRLQWLQNEENREGNPGVFYREKVCSKEIWYECCGMGDKNFPNTDQRDINACLAFLGWERSKSNFRISKYGVQRGFLRPDKDKK